MTVLWGGGEKESEKPKCLAESGFYVFQGVKWLTVAEGDANECEFGFLQATRRAEGLSTFCAYKEYGYNYFVNT